jgi:nucleoside-diphosphate-sugar epimerase
VGIGARSVEDMVTSRAGANPLAADLDYVLEAMGSLWDDLRGARLFITGGTGFFGCWLLETLLWANDRLGLDATAVVLTRDPEAFREKAPHLATHAAVTLHEGDVRTFAFPAGRFTHVIHAATSSSVPVVPAAMFDTIVGGTARTLECARRAGAGRFLLISSGAVYGTQPAELERVGEDYVGAPDPTAAGHAYGEGKRAAEMLCALHAEPGFEPVIARCFAFVGPYLPLDSHFAIGNFIRDGLAGGPIRVSGDGTPFRSYLYAADLAIWLWTILLRGRPMRPYNVGSGAGLAIRELAAAVAASFSIAPTVEVAQKARPLVPSVRYVPDVLRAELELGLRAVVPLEDGIKRTITWQETVVPGVRG